MREWLFSSPLFHNTNFSLALQYGISHLKSYACNNITIVTLQISLDSIDAQFSRVNFIYMGKQYFLIHK